MAAKRKPRVIRARTVQANTCRCRHQRIGSWRHHADVEAHIWCTLAVQAGVLTLCRHPGDGTESECPTWAPFERSPEFATAQDAAQYFGCIIERGRYEPDCLAMELYKGFILVHNKMYKQWQVIGYNRPEEEKKLDGNWDPRLLYMTTTRKAARAACDLMKGKQ